jgi:hypothetical protein
MIWHYNCPECSQPTEVKWEWLEKEVICTSCGATHYPPTPHEDHYAYVDTNEWPSEIEEAVTALRGTVCAVPGCYHERETFVHRRPATLGGRTSVDNLLPMCKRHAESKTERDYDEWLAEVRQQEAEKACKEPQIEITITTRRPDDKPAVEGYTLMSGIYLPITSGRPERPVRAKSGAPTPQRILAVPFLRGTMARLLFDYDCQMAESGLCRVYLLAWPRDEEPRLADLGGPCYAGVFAVKEHLGVAGDKCNYQLELTLPDAPGGRWVAAVAVIDEGCDLALTEYALAGTT